MPGIINRESLRVLSAIPVEIFPEVPGENSPLRCEMRLIDGLCATVTKPSRDARQAGAAVSSLDRFCAPWPLEAVGDERRPAVSTASGREQKAVQAGGAFRGRPRRRGGSAGALAFSGRRLSGQVACSRSR